MCVSLYYLKFRYRRTRDPDPVVVLLGASLLLSLTRQLRNWIRLDKSHYITCPGATLDSTSLLRECTHHANTLAPGTRVHIFVFLGGNDMFPHRNVQGVGGTHRHAKARATLEELVVRATTLFDRLGNIYQSFYPTVNFLPILPRLVNPNKKCCELGLVYMDAKATIERFEKLLLVAIRGSQQPIYIHRTLYVLTRFFSNNRERFSQVFGDVEVKSNDFRSFLRNSRHFIHMFVNGNLYGHDGIHLSHFGQNLLGDMLGSFIANWIHAFDHRGQ